jgi:D-beta-D-heptose 7-phosphate kinase/D-beta-D-heptose 1-phosphate adenosyltransferase
MSAMLRAVDRFARRRVLVLGEAILDSYLFGDSTRLCQEAPVPVVAVRKRCDHPGGAANTALNLAALGCQVGLLSVVGDDSEGQLVRQLLAQQGVDVDLVAVQAGRQTLAKHRVVNGGALVVRVDQGDTEPVGRDAERLLLDRLAAVFPHVDAVVVSDYGYGVMTERLVNRIAVLQGRSPRLIAVDARDLVRYHAAGITTVKPNFEEAARLVGASPSDAGPSRADAALAIGETVLQRTGARIAAITLDRDGAVIVERGRPAYRTYAEPANQARAAGAGDTYIGAFALALAAGAPTPVAAEIAGAAAAVAVSRDGTAACTSDDLRMALRRPTSARPARRQARRPSFPHRGSAAENDPALLGAGTPELNYNAGERRDQDDVGEGRAPALHQA